MKKSNVILIVTVAYVIGVLSGLLWASYKGPPPALQGRRASSVMPGNAPAKHDDHVDDKIKALNEAIKTDPDNDRLYVQAGDLLFDAQRYQEAIDYYEKALKIEGENPDVLTDTGVVYRRLGQPEKAAAYFRRARKADPKHLPSAYNLGIVLLHDLQDKDGALEAWQQYLALNPAGERADHIRHVMDQLKKIK